MGGRGAFDPETETIPIENRQYFQMGDVDGIKIIGSDHYKNGKPPVMSNSKDTTYAMWSQTANRIKQILFFKDHLLYKQIDIDGAKSHWHNVEVGEDGQIGRISHDPDNIFNPSESDWELINVVSKWTKK